MVNTRFWDDEFVMGLDPSAKLLFLYFLTNPLTDLCGAYEISLRRIAFDTGLRTGKIEQILSQFEAAGKMVYRQGWLLIRNFGKHQQGNSPNVKKGAARSLSNCPNWIKETLSKGWGSVGIENAPEPIGITSGENLTEQPEPAPTEREVTVDAVDAFKLGYPLTDLFKFFPRLVITSGQCGMIQAEVKDNPTDRLAWTETMKHYAGNHDPANGRYDPAKVGNLLSVFKSKRKEVERNGSNQGGGKRSPGEIIANREYR
jgi:hypothetical protein